MHSRRAVFSDVMEDYNIIRIGEGSYQHLVTLIGRCFGSRVTLEQVRAKYATGPFGAADIGFLAMAKNGQPAAYYGVFPIIIDLFGERVLAAQSGDTMTDPDHQKKGLFIKLAGSSYELAERSGIKFIFGFPNENSLPGFQRKLGWTFCGHLHDFKLSTGALPLCELASRWKWLAPLYKSIVEKRSATVRADRPISSAHDSCSLRDDRFFRYKEALGARWVYQDTVRLFVKPDIHLYIGEFVADESMPPAELEAAMVRMGRRLLCGKVVCTFSGNHPAFELMSRITQAKRSLPIGYKDLGSGLPIEKLVYTRTDLDTF
jgi:hypothetical protein